jgi:hypothetical protein
MEGNASVRIRSWRAVLQVTFDRASKVGELAADLMVTAGLKFYLYEPVSVSLAYLSVVELCKFGILACSARTAYI